MCDKLISNSENPAHSHDYQQELDTFKKYNNIMLKIVSLQDVDARATQMPKWLAMMIKCSKTTYTKICLVSVEVFIQILSYEDRSVQEMPQKPDTHRKHKEEKGGTVLHIQRLIADPSGKSGRFKEKTMKNFKEFKQDFLQLLQEKGDNETSGNAHCKEIIQNLWSLLDHEIDTNSIVTHLKEFDQLVPRIFSDVVIQDLTQDLDKGLDQDSKDKRMKQDRAIKRFTVFWKHTANYYPSYKPFETEVNRKKYCALHNMINFLEHTDPTLRLQCRSWLSQNKQYNRILDPIIEEFIQNSKFKQSKEDDDAVFIESRFETQYVIENFGKLRNIILNTQDEIIEYMVGRTGQQHILQLYYENQYVKGPAQPVAFPVHLDKRASMALHEPQSALFSPDNASRDQRLDQIVVQQNYGEPPRYEIAKKLYLDMLVEITLQFIRAEYSNEHQEKFLIRNQQSIENQLAETLTVNASACEFMELILKQVQRYGSVSYKIAHVIIGPLINTFYHVINKKNYAMQVNIINLLDLILNECNFQGTKHGSTKEQVDDPKIIKQKCEEILKNQKLIEGIILGLKSDVSFVRQKFIKFVEMLVPYMRKFTKENDSFKDTFKSYIERLMDIFCELLKKVDVSFFSAQQKMVSNQFKAEEKESKGDYTRATTVKRPSGGESFKADVRKSLGAIEDTVTFETLVINQETDIIQIIGGLQGIINTILDIKSHESNQDLDVENNEEDDILLAEKKGKNDQNKNQGLFSGLFGGGESTGYFASDSLLDIKQVIYEKLPNVFVSCVHCWNHLSLLN